MSEKKLAPVSVRALRTKESGTYERLLCQLLIRANASDGLKKIELMCQAYHRAKPLIPQNPIQINEDEVDIIHNVVLGLKYATFYPLPYAHAQGKYIEVAWPFDFTSENYHRYIEPWYKVGTLRYYPYIGAAQWPSDYEEFSKKYEDYLDRLTIESRFFCLTTGTQSWGLKLCQTGFDRLLSQFQIYAMPKVEEWYLELTKLVDPGLFDEIFKTMYMGEKKTTEKEEE